MSRETVTFTVDGPPRVKERPRFAKGRTYTPARTADYEKKVSAAATEAARESGLDAPIDQPVAVKIIFGKDESYVKVNALNESFSSPMRGDIDNYIKAILDGIQKDEHGRTAREDGTPLLADDKHVVILTADKHMPDLPF